MLHIHLIVVAFALAEDLLKLYEAANASNITWHIFLHSNFADVVEVCESIAIGNRQVHLYDYRKNRGLARSWNDGLFLAYRRDAADIALIANDDALPAEGDVQKIAEFAFLHPEFYRVTGFGYDVGGGFAGDMRFAMCAVNPVALEAIGYFDENFWPVYFEDIDWYLRAELAGLKHHMVQDTHIVHQGSKTFHTAGEQALHHTRFRANRAYYKAKWGADENNPAVFTMPFGDPALELKISAEQRHAPYPGYNRGDLG
jgi:GT2 family glycosyltransferase